MKLFLSHVLAGVFIGIFASSAYARPWPTHSVKLVVPYPPGGASDFSGRVYAEQLTKILGESFVVENKAGASGDIGAGYVARSAPDGYTLLMAAIGSHAIHSVLPSTKPGYKFPGDFEGVSMATTTPLAVVVRSSLPVYSIQDLIALAKNKPGVLSFGSAGIGSPEHMTGEKFQLDTGTKLLHVPYKGSGPAISGLMGGQVDVVFDTLPTLLPQIHNDKVRFLAVTTRQRTPLLPKIKTLQELGVKNFNISTRYALLAPKGTPKEVIDRLSAAMKKITEMPAVQKKMTAQGAQALFTTPKQTDQALKQEVAIWADVAKRADIK